MYLHIGSTDDESVLRSAFADVDYAFVNINSFALGIKNEIYWGIRIFEIAVQSGVKHYIWSSLDNYAASTGFNEELRCGHYYGKGHVEQWMAALPQMKMKWSILTTGPYIEMLSERLRPVKREADGVYVFRAPLANGAVPFVHLDDLGPYVHWILSHPTESAGLNLKVAIEHVSYAHLVDSFTRVTGETAVYENPSIEEYFAEGPFTPVAEVKLGAQTAGEDDTSLLTYRDNFSAWWRLYQGSGGNKGLIRRDYEFLDRIFPDRVKSVEQWMRKVVYTGEERTVLKTMFYS